jgi:hypothetical protein
VDTNTGNKMNTNNPFGISKQEMFDIAYKGVVDQGCQSTEPGTSDCRYKSEDGSMCAAGYILAETHPDLVPDEDSNIRSVLKLAGLIPSIYVPNEYVVFAMALQRAHDKWDAKSENGADFVPYYKEQMRLVAEEYKLKCEVA